MFVGVYGDPATHDVDAIWAFMRTSRGVSFGPQGSMPVGTRLLGTFVDDKRRPHLLLESRAYRGQPAGLRAIVEIPRLYPLGLSPPADVATAKKLLPLVDGWSLPLFVGGATVAGPVTLARYAEPGGVAVEELYQTYFRREVGRLAPGSAPFLALERGIEQLHVRDCARGKARYAETKGLCWAPLAPWDDVTFGGTESEPRFRSVGKTPPVAQMLGASTAAPTGTTDDEHRAVLAPVLRTQPFTGSVVATGSLAPSGGTVGLVRPDEGPTHAPLLVRVDGIAHAFSSLHDLAAGGLTAQHAMQARFLESATEPTRLLVRLEDRQTDASGRAAHRPWTVVLRIQHPLLEARGMPWGEGDIESALTPFLSAATTLDEAAAAARTPRFGVALPAARALLASARARRDLLANATASATVTAWTRPARSPLLEPAVPRPIADITDEELARFREASRVEMAACRSDQPYCWFFLDEIFVEAWFDRGDPSAQGSPRGAPLRLTAIQTAPRAGE
jgi:hypothetical protein